MSNTYKNTKSIGLDFWSRRCFGDTGIGFGSTAKWITKRKERQRNRTMTYKALINPNDFETRFAGE